jgi:hypothetical protein
MPKVYDHERGNLVDVQQGEILPPQSDETTPLYVGGIPVKIGLAEALGCLSALYVFCIAAFNAGYFSSVGGRFVELFSFSDLVGVNIPILQYFLSVYAIYSLFGLANTLGPTELFSSFRTSIDAAIVDSYYWDNTKTKIFWAGALIVFLFLSDLLSDKSFNVAIAPYFFFQGLGLYWLWVGWKNEFVAARTLAATCLIGITYFSLTSGRLWALDDVRDSKHLQSITLKNGQCLDRIFLRNNSAGYLLYSFDLKQFEFRNKDDIATIFASKGCV